MHNAAMELDLIQKICIWALPVLFAITVHEVAHGWVAYQFGDQTAKLMGRLTLNPIKHIDWLGTVILPIVMLALGGFIFGWAKPVPISARNFKNPRPTMALVALAGPLANFLMAIIWVLIAKLGLWMTFHISASAAPVILMGKAGVAINLFIALLNLIPLPPLDGGRIISNLIPLKASYYYDKIEPFGFLILLGLLWLGVLSWLIGPLYMLLSQVLLGWLG
jgi:Zn-dependent protease